MNSITEIYINILNVFHANKIVIYLFKEYQYHRFTLPKYDLKYLPVSDTTYFVKIINI